MFFFLNIFCFINCICFVILLNSMNFLRVFSFINMSFILLSLIFILGIFNKSIVWYQLIYNWFIQFKYFNFYFILGIDGISIFFLVLSSFLLLSCLLAYWNLKYRLYLYVVCLFLALWLLLSVFTTLDFIYFYMYFEWVVLPLFLLIVYMVVGVEKFMPLINFLYIHWLVLFLF